MRLSQEAIQRMISGRSGGGAGGGGSFDPSVLAGYATQAWTEENYISKTFFNELFIIHKKVTTVVMDGETEISRTVTTNTVFAPNEIPGTTEITDEETGYVTTVTTEIASIESKKGFWTNYFLSALGLSDSGGSGGVSSLSELIDVQLSSPSNGQALIYDSSIGKWRNGAAGIDMTALTTYLTSKVLTIKNGSATLGTWNPTAAGVIDIASAVSGYLPLTGGSLTGNLNIVYSHDLSKSDNGVSDTLWPGYRIYDKDGRRSAQFVNGVYSNGSNFVWMSVSNYDTSGNMIADYGIGLSVDKNGAGTWSVSEPAAFRTAIGIPALLGGYLPLSGGTMTGTLKVATGIGIEDATGNGLLVYHPTNWSGVSASQWGVGAIDCQGVIRSNASDLKHYRGGTSYNIFDGYNSGIVDGHKVNLNGTSIEVPVAYSIPSPGSFTSGYWHKLGDYVTAGDSSNLVLEIYDGNGYNAQAEQNSILRVVIKDGWQSTRAAANSVGVTIERFGVWAADMQISIVATDHNAGAVWIYFPWQYAAGTYMVSGNYSTWTHNSGTTGDTTTEPATNQTMSTGGTHSYVYLDNAYTNSNVASATKLHTARSLWGNSFDGTADINGNLIMPNNRGIVIKDTNGVEQNVFVYNHNNDIVIGWGPRATSDTYITGNTVCLATNGGSAAVYVNAYNNVGVGTTSPSYKLDVNGTINCTSIRIGGYTITADTTNQGLRINSAGLYADTYISALGANSGGGGGGGVTLNEPLSSINNASMGSPSGTDMAIVWSGSAWTYKQMPSGGGGGGGGGTVTSVGMTVPTGFSVNPASITSSGTFAITFASGYSLPTTAKQSNWDTAYNNNHQHSNKSVLDGITSAMVTKWNNCVSASDVTMQLQNYAYINGNVIHIGDNSITPLTSHQSVDGTFWGCSWSNHCTVNGDMSSVGNISFSASGKNIGGLLYFDTSTPQLKVNTSSTGSYMHGDRTIYPKLYVSGEFGVSGGLWAGFNELYYSTPYIDFHYDYSQADYTTRLIESEAGILSILSPNVAGLLVGGYNGDYVQIGQIRIVYESSNNALRIENANGAAANLYALGGISALGMSGNADGTIGGSLIPSTNKTYTLGNSSYRWKYLYLSYGSDNFSIEPGGGQVSFNTNTGFYFNSDTEIGGDLYVNDHLGVGDTDTSYALYVYGNAKITGGLSYNSDMRLKDFLANKDIDVENIARAPLFDFRWKDTHIDNDIHIGTSAQYWRGVLSETVNADSAGMLSLDYGVTALAGVISVARKVMTHEERIAALEAENERLRNEIETLKAA